LPRCGRTGTNSSPSTAKRHAGPTTNAKGLKPCIPLKGNQPTLEADVEDYFRTAPARRTRQQNHRNSSSMPL
jgi:hypothetical protein